MKRNKETKQGISLIVLVITIIVMIILATAVVLTLSNSGIISKTNDAVLATDLANMQDLATMLWADKYLDLKEDGVIDAKDLEDLKEAVEEGLEKADKNYSSKYNVEVTESGVTVTKAGEKTSNVPTEWQAYVSDVTEDGVPIPKGFVASPYGADEANGLLAENTKEGGLVIYELNDKDIAEEDQFTSWTTRNQYVWVPVDNFEQQFVRKGFLGESVVTSEGKYNSLGTSYWEVIIDETTKLPKTTLTDAESAFMSPETLTEVQAMYASVKEYGGFYIARYEAGVDDANWRIKKEDELSITLANVHSKMNKIPYNFVKWSSSRDMKEDEGGAVQVARSLYTSDPTDVNYTKYGVVSTLTYGVQWDRTVQWFIDTDAMEKDEVTKTKGSTAYGNYSDHDIKTYTELNSGARYTTSGTIAFSNVTSSYTKGSDTTDVSHILTTGALKAAKVNNIYDMAGNMYEWTMEGYSTAGRVGRGGRFYGNGDSGPVSYRGSNDPNYADYGIGFRPSLYIKK